MSAYLPSSADVSSAPFLIQPTLSSTQHTRSDNHTTVTNSIRQSPPSSHAPPSARSLAATTRVSAACSTCRTRKRKCDGVKPACGSCVRVGATSACKYLELPKKPRQARTGHLSQLKAEVIQLKQTLQQLTMASASAQQSSAMPSTTISPSFSTPTNTAVSFPIAPQFSDLPASSSAASSSSSSSSAPPGTLHSDPHPLPSSSSSSSSSSSFSVNFNLPLGPDDYRPYYVVKDVLPSIQHALPSVSRVESVHPDRVLASVAEGSSYWCTPRSDEFVRTYFKIGNVVFRMLSRKNPLLSRVFASSTQTGASSGQSSHNTPFPGHIPYPCNSESELKSLAAYRLQYLAAAAIGAQFMLKPDEAREWGRRAIELSNELLDYANPEVVNGMVCLAFWLLGTLQRERAGSYLSVAASMCTLCKANEHNCMMITFLDNLRDWPHPYRHQSCSPSHCTVQQADKNSNSWCPALLASLPSHAKSATNTLSLTSFSSPPDIAVSSSSSISSSLSSSLAPLVSPAYTPSSLHPQSSLHPNARLATGMEGTYSLRSMMSRSRRLANSDSTDSAIAPPVTFGLQSLVAGARLYHLLIIVANQREPFRAAEATQLYEMCLSTREELSAPMDLMTANCLMVFIIVNSELRRVNFHRSRAVELADVITPAALSMEMTCPFISVVFYVVGWVHASQQNIPLLKTDMFNLQRIAMMWDYGSVAVEQLAHVCQRDPHIARHFTELAPAMPKVNSTSTGITEPKRQRRDTPSPSTSSALDSSDLESGPFVSCDIDVRTPVSVSVSSSSSSSSKELSPMLDASTAASPAISDPLLPLPSPMSFQSSHHSLQQLDLPASPSDANLGEDGDVLMLDTPFLDLLPRMYSPGPYWPPDVLGAGYPM